MIQKNGFENFCAEKQEVVTNSGFTIYCRANNVFFWRDETLRSEYECLFDYKYDAECWKKKAEQKYPRYQWQVVELEALWRVKKWQL